MHGGYFSAAGMDTERSASLSSAWGSAGSTGGASLHAPWGQDGDVGGLLCCEAHPDELPAAAAVEPCAAPQVQAGWGAGLRWDDPHLSAADALIVREAESVAGELAAGLWLWAAPLAC